MVSEFKFKFAAFEKIIGGVIGSYNKIGINYGSSKKAPEVYIVATTILCICFVQFRISPLWLDYKNVG